ncbi:MAG: hypothetical protein ACOC6S_01535 [Chloroflexota bacterium]
MNREIATMLLNRLADDQIMGAKEKIEEEIEKAVDENLAKAKEEIMQTVNQKLGEHILSGREAILNVLEKAAADTDFVAKLTENPEEVLQDYGLTDEEKAAIASGDIRRIENWVGKLSREQSKWLWQRLQQERW